MYHHWRRRFGLILITIGYTYLIRQTLGVVVEQAWLKCGTYCMGFGTILFLLLLGKAKRHDRAHFSILIFIVATAMASYTAMSLNQTHFLLGDGHAIYAARYLDWLVTTPLLLLSMGYIAARSLRTTGVALAGAIGADIYMIVTGLAGGLTSGDGKWVWYTLSCAGFVAVLVLLWGSIRAQARIPERTRAYTTLSGILTVLWVQYPIVWLLGSEGLGRLSPTGETAWFTVLDVLAKVGFGIVSIALMKTFPDEQPEPAWTNSTDVYTGQKTDVVIPPVGTSSSTARR